MWLKIISFIGLVLEVFYQLLQSVSEAKQRDEGKLEQNAANEKTIEGEVDEANNIRSSAGQLDNDLLLKPEQRQQKCDTGGVPGVSADLRGITTGSAGAQQTGSGGADKGAQPYMGRQLSPFTFDIPKRKVDKVFIHCSASDRPEDDNVATINAWHIARGWEEIGYNYYIDKQGRVWAGRDVEKIPAAQHGYNTGSIAVCCGGLSAFTVAEFYSLKAMCGVINKAYGGKVSFHGHCEVNAGKTCPNFDYRSVLGLDAAGNLAQK